jgi:predicted NodU family carbamoyl transferase
LEVEELFIQPASSNAGISLGGTQLASAQKGFLPGIMTHVFYGNTHSHEAIEQALKNCNVTYSKTKDVVADAATALAENKVIR